LSQKNDQKRVKTDKLCCHLFQLKVKRHPH
jgi:hypothetical protein